MVCLVDITIGGEGGKEDGEEKYTSVQLYTLYPET